MAQLYAPSGYWSYKIHKPEELAKLVNGCGPDGWKRKLIPDSILRVNIKEACDIHDWMYIFGETEADREAADRVFLNNMLRIVEEESKWFITRKIRRKIAYTYYEAVRDVGGMYFWQDKNPPSTFKDPKEIEAARCNS